MVAINNNLTEKFKVLTSKNSLEQNDDLFAELFALINTNIENSEEKSLLKNVMIESTKEPIGSLSVEANQIKEKPYDSDNELELAKSLIKIFYKEFGIDDSISQTEKHKNPFKIDKLNVPLDEIKKETTKNTLPDQKTFSEKLDPKLGNQKTLELSENLVLKIEKKKSPKNKIVPDKLERIYKFNKINNLESIQHPKKSEILEKGEIQKKLSVNQIPNQIEKKNIKKNKQLNKSIKNTNEISNFTVNETKISVKANNPTIQKIQNPRENKILMKKETLEKNDFKLSDSKQTFSNQGGREFLNLLESSWGVKFSQIIKNSLKNGINKVEIELKPHNLGKLNLEVSLKNNKTFINISTENQEVLNILNENLPRFTDIIEKESKSFSSLFNNDSQQNNNFNDKSNKQNLPTQENLNNKKKIGNSNVEKISNHNIDVNA